MFGEPKTEYRRMQVRGIPAFGITRDSEDVASKRFAAWGYAIFIGNEFQG